MEDGLKCYQQYPPTSRIRKWEKSEIAKQLQNRKFSLT